MRIAALVATLAICMLAAGASPLPAGLPAPRGSATGPERGDGLETYVITSDYQETPCKLHVLLPRGFDKSKRYKVLYVLPAWAPSSDGIAEAKKLGLADTYNVVCVQPEFSGMPWYADKPGDPKCRNDSYLPEVIVPFVDKTYPTVAAPEGRLLVGFSKSGIGAVSLLLRYPEIFGRAGSWDAPLMEDRNRPEYYGSDENFHQNYYVPTLLAAKAKVLAGKPARMAIAGEGWGSTAKAHQLMDRLGIPHYVNESLLGAHEWTSGWLGPLVQVLMAEDMTRPTSDGRKVK